MLKQLKNKKILPPVKLLKGGTLEEYNRKIAEMLKFNGLNGHIEFNVERLQQLIKQEDGSFGRGLVLYLKELEEQLNQITDDKELQLYVFQILSELGSLVFPNTSAYYSIIPGDLKSIDWERELKNKDINIVKGYPKIQQLINKFENTELNKTLVCLISMCLCELVVLTDDK